MIGMRKEMISVLAGSVLALFFFFLTCAYVQGSEKKELIEPVIDCPKGTTWNPSAMVCESAPICPEGGVFNAQTKRCEATPRHDCPIGWTLDKEAEICYQKPVRGTTNICEASSELINKHVELPQHSIERKKLISEGMCEVIFKVQDEYATAYVSENYVIIGALFTKRSTPALAVINDLQKKAFADSKSKLDEIVAFSYGTGQPIYFITDPECFHCEKAKAELKDFSSKNNVQIKTIVYPISAKTRNKAVRAYCGRMTYDDYVNNKYPANGCEAGEDKVSKATSLLAKLGVQGTPTFITSAGEKILGFIPDRILEAVAGGKSEPMF